MKVLTNQKLLNPVYKCFTIKNSDTDRFSSKRYFLNAPNVGAHNVLADRLLHIWE